MGEGDSERSGDYHRYGPEGGGLRQPNGLERFMDGVYRILDGPVTWFRETVVTPNQTDYNWYHRNYRRVPTIDECLINDPVCIYEANSQFKRDRLVDSEIVYILRMRLDACWKQEYPDHKGPCKQLEEDLKLAEENWFSKYGDLGAFYDVRMAFMKQKHRMIWERRHGKIGSGCAKKNEVDA